jgi:hypothetical protein
VININGNKIIPEKVVKFLGLYFETDLKWNLQVEASRQKCIRPMAIISYLNYVDGSRLCDTPAVIHSSNQVTHSVWNLFHSLTKGQMDLLGKVQRKATRLAFGYMRMTPKNVMLAEAKISPIIS